MKSTFEQIIFVDLVELLDKNDFDTIISTLTKLKNNIIEFLCDESDYSEALALELINKIEIFVIDIKNNIENKDFARYRLYILLKCYEKACCIIETLLSSFPSDIELLQDAAIAHYHNKDIETAYKYAQTILYKQENNKTGLWISAYYYATIKNRQLLKDSLTRLITSNLNNVIWWRFCNRPTFTDCLGDDYYLTTLYEQYSDMINSVEVALFLNTCYRRLEKRLKKNFPNRKSTLDTLILRYPQNIDVLLAVSQYFCDARENEEALDYAITAFQLDSNNYKVNITLGDIYIKQDNKEEAIIHYNKANMAQYSSYLTSVLLKLARECKNQTIYKEMVELSDKQNDYSILIHEWLIVKNEEACQELCEIIENIWDSDYSSLSAKLLYDSKRAFFDKLFFLTNTFPDRRDCRAASIAMYETVIELKEQLTFRHSSFNMREICHYSKIASLCHLIKDKSEPARLRVSNVAYMNDPSEGVTFIELLSKLNVPDNVMCSLYPFYNGNSINDIAYSNTFLGSFTLSKDALPMWTQYGAGGTGCCYVFSDDFFDYQDKYEPIIDDVWNTNEKVNSNLVLYRVEYINLDEENTLTRRRMEKFQRLSKCLIELSRWISTNREIKEMVVSLLDQIRFLYKDIAYRHENEVRLVITNPSSIRTTNNGEYAVPRLYVELDKPLSFSEVVLGPKIVTPSEVAPYIQFMSKDTKVSKSKIKFR